MIELAIGTRFYCKCRLCEVVERKSNDCMECAIEQYNDCISIVCSSSVRHDNKDICIKWVEE